MKKSFVLACLVSGVALSMSACDEGAHTNLECDSSYVAECLDSSHYMTCEGNTLVVNECGATQYCHAESTTDADGNVTRGPASCVNAGVNPTPTCDCTTGANCTDAEKAECNKTACDCATGANCTDAEKAECNKTTCDCATGANCTDAEKAECNKTACDCATGANCTDAEKAECNKTTCDCATGENCTEEEKAECSKTDDCTSVCGDNNALTITCGEDVTEVTCAVACDTDKNECKAMSIDDYGTACDDTYADTCVGSLLSYCNGKTVSAFFCSNGTTCQISQNLDGYGDCVKKCETPTEVTNKCVYSEDYEGYLIVEDTCETINGENYHFESAIELCYTGCNDTNTGCKLANENDACQLTDPDACAEDGSYTIYCYQGDGENFLTGDICPQGTTCMIDEEGAAGCITPCTEAEVGNELRACSSLSFFGLEFPMVSVQVCADLGNGKYGYIEDDAAAEFCNHSCDETTKSCVTYHETEGDVCDASYASTCDGSIALTCYIDEDEGEVFADDCSEYGSNYSCKVVDGSATCIESCTEAGATRTHCVEGDFEDMVVTQTCTDNVWVDGEEVYTCSLLCADDYSDCQKIVEDEYSECDETTYTDTCSEDGIARYCDEGRVVALDCSSESQICRVDEDNFADCHDLCVKEGEVTTICSSVTDTTYTFTCTRMNDGILIDVLTDTEECTNGCADSNKACK